MQGTGLTRFAPVKPEHWVVASGEHHTSPSTTSRALTSAASSSPIWPRRRKYAGL